jgi:hypothetical protein
VDKNRFLDVNGFSSEYGMPLEERLNKYQGRSRRRGSSASVSETERLNRQSAEWRENVRRRQATTAVVMMVFVAIAVALSCYLAYFAR